jgi:hypothetical protein
VASTPLTGACSITRTRRRRFLWCAWWTAAPTREPFQPPDAWSGGARTLEEAQAAAERAAGRPLRRIEPRWAKAFVRLKEGLPAWPTRAPNDPARAMFEAPADPRQVLGVGPAASAEEIKAAFRREALATHPDRGGDAEAFMRAKAAYDRLRTRRRRRR